jgi:FSR family fosmidomycin resistance protein-like MFS transporter
VLQAGFGLSLLTFPWMVWSPSPALSLLMVAITAALFFSPSSPAVVLGQEYLPNRVGMASGVTIGLAVSVGGMVVPLLGWLGDIYGLGVVFLIMEAMLAVCFLSTLLLPDPRISTREEPQPA